MRFPCKSSHLKSGSLQGGEVFGEVEVEVRLGVGVMTDV